MIFNPESTFSVFFENQKKNRPDLLINDYYQYIVPVYKNVIYKDSNSIDLCGSSFFIKTSKGLFFITCAHVVKECLKSEKKEILIPVFVDKVKLFNILDASEIDSPPFISQEMGEDCDKVDIFVQKINLKYESLLVQRFRFFFEKDCCENIKNIHFARKLTTIGYPASKNKVRQNYLLKIDLYTYTGKELEWNEIDLKKYNIASHIIYRCQVNDIRDNSEIGPHKPDAHGISGGCIFDISEETPIKLAGMILEKYYETSEKKNTFFVGLNIQTILNFIKAYD